MITAVTVANNFIRHSLDEGIHITPMKLQKLIYFLYKDFLQTTEQKLFSESFEVWQYGPVLPSVYEEFKAFGANSINRFARDSVGDVYTVTENGIFKTCFDRVWEKYKSQSAWSLSVLTHVEGTAWAKARMSNRPILDDEDIKNEK